MYCGGGQVVDVRLLVLALVDMRLLVLALVGVRLLVLVDVRRKGRCGRVRATPRCPRQRGDAEVS